MSDSTASGQLQTALSWIEACNSWSLDAIAAHLTDDYHHYILPESLGRPVLTTKEEYVEFMRPLLRMFQAFHVTVKEVVEQPGKVVLHASSTAISITGAPYANEYMFIIHFRETQDGACRIASVKEFVDSRFTTEFFAAERKRISDGTSGL